MNSEGATRAAPWSTGGPLRFEVVLGAEQLDALAVLVAERLDSTQPQSQNSWLNTTQAADYLGCKPDRLHDLVARRALAHGRDGRRLLFRRSDLDSYAESGRA